jgi:hypothetical protein
MASAAAGVATELNLLKAEERQLIAGRRAAEVGDDSEINKANTVDQYDRKLATVRTGIARCEARIASDKAAIDEAETDVLACVRG